MSRIIVKHLPSNVTEKRIRETFGSCGEVTDVKLMKSRAGIFRRFGFVGFSSEAAAEGAVKYFNNTFIDSSKVVVEIAKPYQDATLPRPWSRHSKGSSSFQRRQGGKDEGSLEGKDEGSSEARSQQETTKSKLTQLLEAYTELERDTKFQEFVALHKPKAKAPTWLDDAVGVASASLNAKEIKQVNSRERKNEDKEEDGEEEEDEEKDGEEEEAGEEEEDEEEDGEEEEDKEKDGEEEEDEEEDGEEEEDEEEDGEEDKEEKKEEAVVDSSAKVVTSYTSDMDYLRSKVVKQDKAAGNVQTHSKPQSILRTVESSECDDLIHHDSVINPSQCNVETVASTPYTVKMRGLPFHTKEADIRTFFHPLTVVAVRFTSDSQGRPSGRAYVDFDSEADLQEALKHNGECIHWRYIELFRDEGPQKKPSKEEKPSGRPWEAKLGSAEDESIAESGRLFIRNLPFTTMEDDITKLLEPFGPLTEVLVHLDKETNKPVGLAFATFMLPEHAVKACEALDGSIFQGRLLHILPAKPRETREPSDSSKTKESSYKKKKEKEMKAQAGSTHNWNTLFLGANAVADVMVERFGTDKGTLLSANTNHSVAVRMALGETQLVSETRQFLEAHGVDVSLFGQDNMERSKTVIVVKNLPHGTTSAELKTLFSPFGPLNDIILPPSGISGLVVFLEAAHAREAFRKLAYTKFRHVPLYLEWAPLGVIDQRMKNKNVQSTIQNSDDVASTEQCSVFVKNLNFSTSDKALKDHFSKIGGITTAVVARKHNTRDPAHPLSTGFGFVQFSGHQLAMKAIKELQHSMLDGHPIELKLSNRQHQRVVNKEKTKLQEQMSAKIMVRNVPFEATKKEITELFRAFGEVKTVRLPKKLGGQSKHRGFAFVEFLTKQDAKRAFESLSHSTHLYGRRLVLEWAEEEESVEAIRKRTLEHFNTVGDNRSKKRKGEELLFCLADE